jgi:tetratricopeptide (TPR) repeat protein
MYLALAWAYLCLEQYDNAILNYDKACKLDPDCAASYKYSYSVDYKNLKKYNACSTTSLSK